MGHMNNAVDLDRLHAEIQQFDLVEYEPEAEPPPSRLSLLLTALVLGLIDALIVIPLFGLAAGLIVALGAFFGLLVCTGASR